MTRSTLGFILLALGLLGGPRALAETPPLAVTPSRYDDGPDRMQWFREARFGMFVHFGPFSLRSRDAEQWKDLASRPAAMPAQEYDRRITTGLRPKPGSARQWAELARRAGMKYMVFTAKHHEGFCLWDSKLTDFNSVKLGPGYDMVREYVAACRAAGLKVGIYYSLLDRHHPDGLRCEQDEAARQRFLEYTRGLVRELMTNYGKIDILWYDGPSPLGYASAWEGARLNTMVRRLQPGIVINDRALTVEDFTCSEGHVNATAFPNQDWEACITFNGSWGYDRSPLEKYLSVPQIVRMLNQVSAMTGNLLLNVGPNPDGGSVGPVESERLLAVGQWLAQYGEGVYGKLDRVDAIGETRNNVGGLWSRRGNTGYLWITQWPETAVVLENVRAKVLACSLVPGGKPLPMQQKDCRVTISGLPASCPASSCPIGMLKIEFASYPR